MRYRLPLLLLLCLIGWLSYIWITTTIEYPAYFWYRVDAQLEYRGETVDVGGVVECKRESSALAGYFIPVPRPRGAPLFKYQTNTLAFAKRLADGSAVIMRHGVTCNRRVHERLKSRAGTIEVFDGLVAGHNHNILYPKQETRRFPLIRWLDDAEAPSKAETYFADLYYGDPRARFRFLGLDVRRIGKGGVTDPHEMMAVERQRAFTEVPWLLQQSQIARSDQQGFRGDHGYVIERSEWAADDETAAAVAGADGSENRVFSETIRTPFFDQFRISFFGREAYRCLIERAPAVCAIFERIRLFEPDGDGLSPSDAPNIPGLITLYPTADVNGRDRLARLGFTDGKTLDARRAVATYSAPTGRLYVLLSDGFTVRHHLFRDRPIAP